MRFISVFDILKIGVGPSSSHTLGPWKAASQFLEELSEKYHSLATINTLSIRLHGSLSLTGKGHATGIAVMLGISGYEPETIPVHQIEEIILKINKENKLSLGGKYPVEFNPKEAILFDPSFLDFHANGMTFTAKTETTTYSETFYSIGGGFIVKENESSNISEDSISVPFPIEKGKELIDYCQIENKSISEIVLKNELAIYSQEEIDNRLKDIWNVMLESVYVGCHSEGLLPGRLSVKRRAFDIHKKLINNATYNSSESWIYCIRHTDIKFRNILKWVSCCAIAVNEVNASLGRIVTAPTNGSAGVIPAVLMYYITIENHQADFSHIKRFLLVASEIGSIFKKGATISAAMGGCQAEIGVSSAMAAGALCELLGGTPEQVLVAAEISMEHHLGLTCDPVDGLVQIPCIERNSMGAIKAINAAELALETDPSNSKISLDKVVNTMWETAKGMNSKYKETSQGGLAVSVNLPDC